MQKANQNRLNSQSKGREQKIVSSKRTEDTASDMLGDSMDLSNKINLSTNQARSGQRPQKLLSENQKTDELNSMAAGDYAIQAPKTEKPAK